jgi:hypothetical protein
MMDHTRSPGVTHPAAAFGKRGFLVATLLLVCVGLAVFSRFIFGHAILLYTDIGRDSLSSYYTDFVHLSNYIRSDGFPSWSFHIGMGQDLAYATGFLFLEPITWLPATWIAHALVYQHLFKILIAGLLFFRFLQLRRAPLPVALLGSQLIAFSGYMTMGSCWYLPAEELLVFAAILVGTETVLQRGRWLLLVSAVALVGGINPFYLYLCGLFLVGYVPFRLVADNGWQPAPILTRSLLLVPLVLLGAALGAIITLPFLNVVLNSPRGSGATSAASALASVPVFGFESTAHYITALLRCYSNDLAGTGDGFRGWQNYLEAPLTYCGLISLLLFPQSLLAGSRRHRIIALLFLAWLIIPTVFPWFRHLFWLFKGDYYRTYSLFSIFGIVTLSLIAVRNYLTRGPFNLLLLGLWSIVLVGVLYLPLDALQSMIEPRVRLAVTVYLFLYTVILVTGTFVKKQAWATYMLLVVTALELVHFNWITVSQRQFVKKSELIHGMAARPETFEAVADLKGSDPTFFRTTVLRSGGLGTETDPNDAMLLGYYGTSSYGSFNDSNYIRFLVAVESIPSRRETDTRWAVGLAGNFVLSMFAGEKYALVDDPSPFQNASQYEFVRRYGSQHLLHNTSSLPFGLVFTRYLRDDEFLRLPRDGKEQVLLAAAVLDSPSAAVVGGLSPINASELERELAASSFPGMVEQRRSTGLQITSFSQNKIAGDLHLEQNGILVLQTPFSPGWHASQDGQPVSTVRADVGLLGVPVKAGQHKVELRYRNVWLLAGAGVTGVSVLILAVGWWRRPRLASSLA